MKRPFIGDYKVNITDYEMIKSLVSDGEIIPAIKWFRNCVFCGLKEAKEAIKYEFQRSE